MRRQFCRANYEQNQFKAKRTDNKGVYLRIRLLRNQSYTHRVGRWSNYERLFIRFTKILVATRNV